MQFITDIGFFLKRLRVVPRAFLLLYSWLLHYMVFWVMVQDNITAAQAILTSVIITMATPLTKFYVDTGDNLYRHYGNLVYDSDLMRYIDTLGYIIEKWRIFPMLFVSHFILTLGYSVFWAFGLGADLTNEQATFVSVYAGNASLVLGFYITSDNKNAELEQQFLERHSKKE